MRRLRPIAQNRDVEVVYESVRPVTAAVDEVKITQVISNLVENAIKYNKEHGWVRVKLDADHQYFSVEVADSGIGIPAESIDHIYERFYRVDKSRSREIGGTGLGLAITRSAILMHRGTIKVESIEVRRSRSGYRLSTFRYNRKEKSSNAYEMEIESRSGCISAAPVVYGVWK